MTGFYPGPFTFPGPGLFPGLGVAAVASTLVAARVELDLAGDGTFGTDITHDVRTRDDVVITRGRAEESSSVEPSACTLTINNRSGNYSPRNPAGAYYGYLGRNTPLRVTLDSPTTSLVITAPTGSSPVGGCYVSTPDAGALDITGDIDIRFDADLDSWRKPMELVSKYTATGNQRSYSFRLQTDGKLRFARSTAGSSGTTAEVPSTVAVPVTTGRLAVRVTVDADNGSGNQVYAFYTSDTINGTWTALGAVQTFGGVLTMFSSSAPLRILDNPDNDLIATTIRGRVYAAQVRSGIGGTIVANPDFTAQTHGATSFADSAGRTWTLTGACQLSARDTRFIGEVPAWPVRWDLSGRDIYSPIDAAGVLRRLQQGASPLKSVLYRALTSLARLPVAYWPCEDGSGATVIASGLPDHLPIHFTGSPSLGSDSSFAASESLPQLGQSSLYGYVPIYTSTGSSQIRFLIYVPAAGTTADAVICRIDCAGTATKWELVYKTGGGIQFTGYDAGGASLGGTGVVAFNLDGFPLRMSIQLTTSGPDVAYDLRTARVGVSLGGISGTVTGCTVTRVTKVTMAPAKNLDEVVVGHITVQDVLTSNADLLSEMEAWDGEAAGRRIERLCREEGIAFQGFGDLDDTSLMGVQRPGLLLDLLRECADSDLGVLSESLALLGLAYRPRASLYNQASTATIPYTSLSELTPIEDDAHVTNDVTVSRLQGSSARATRDAGTLSVLAPPAGVGRYDSSVSVSVAADGQLPDQAGWRLHLGTVDEPRYPTIAVNLLHPSIASNAALTRAVRGLDLGDRITVSGPPAARTGPGDISQLVQGLMETIGPRWHQIVFKCSPESPWRVGIYAAAVSPTASKYSSDGSTLAIARNTTQTSWSIATPTGPLWTTDPAEYPFDWLVAGERVTVTAMSGTSSPQTATVTRSVNGVVKAQSAGALIEFYQPAVYAL